MPRFSRAGRQKEKLDEPGIMRMGNNGPLAVGRQGDAFAFAYLTSN
ncbi:MAG: hypothetical protein WBD21_15025 [Candidatus Acidiferrales bacterium]